jgi:type VI secretion system secreted protein VgrG
MEHQVIADIEIEDERIDYYSSIIIRQQFNAHHEFAIRIKYDVLEKIGAFNLSTAQKKIGKLAIIKLRRSDSAEGSVYGAV